MKINTLVVDDNPIYCQAIGGILKEAPQIGICKLTYNGQEALNWIRNHPIDLAFVDISMPIMNGIELTKILRKEHPSIKIIILTSSDDKRQIIELLSLHVGGYVLKNTDRAELLKAIDQVMDDGMYLTKEVYEIYAHFLVYKSKDQKSVKSKVELTPREIEVIKLICEQMTTTQIAGKLFVSDATVNNHRSNIMKKIETNNVVGMVLYAIGKGYFVP